MAINSLGTYAAIIIVNYIIFQIDTRTFEYFHHIYLVHHTIEMWHIFFFFCVSSAEWNSMCVIWTFKTVCLICLSVWVVKIVDIE